MHNFNNVIFGQKAFILNNKGEVLILKRNKVSVYNNAWDVPGGKVEDEETLLEALQREVYEETGLKLEKIVCILTSSRFQGSSEDKPWILRNTYLCQATGKIKLSEEHLEYKWVKPAELGEYEFPTDKDFQTALKLIRNNQTDKLKSVSELV